MAEHDPADVEWMARLLCEAWGVGGVNDIDEHALEQDAIRALDYMAARGEKVTTRGSVPDHMYGRWTDMHDACPMTPRTSAQY